MITLVAALALQGKAHLSMRGMFIEACTCVATCHFEVSGGSPGCNAMGGYSITRGTYAGKDISGIKTAFVVAPNNLLYLYIDCPASKADIAKRLTMALFQDFGKLQGVETAKIGIGRVKGRYTLSINSGATASLLAQPLKGGDGKTPVVLRNVFGDPYDSLWQAKVIDGWFNRPGNTFLLKDTNAYYIADLKVDKKF